jgi:hypothetical protein
MISSWIQDRSDLGIMIAVTGERGAKGRIGVRKFRYDRGRRD